MDMNTDAALSAGLSLTRPYAAISFPVLLGAVGQNVSFYIRRQRLMSPSHSRLIQFLSCALPRFVIFSLDDSVRLQHSQNS